MSRQRTADQARVKTAIEQQWKTLECEIAELQALSALARAGNTADDRFALWLCERVLVEKWKAFARLGETSSTRH
jgi:hypothetical protein